MSVELDSGQQMNEREGVSHFQHRLRPHQDPRTSEAAKARICGVRKVATFRNVPQQSRAVSMPYCSSQDEPASVKRGERLCKALR